jgi:putative flavoprotein involved in K+ transport
MMSSMPAPKFDVVVIGGSQAGLATGYHLAKRGLSFVILEAGPEIGNAWRSRWDSLKLFTPSQYGGLPGMPFPSPKDTYPSKDDVAAYLESYVSAFDLPVRCNARVTSLTEHDGGYLVTTVDEEFAATQVVVATGPFQVPLVPAIADRLDEAVLQIHSASYRNPTQLPEGQVLVVGGGNSGFQIAEELAATRRVDLAVGKRVLSLPQRFLGKDLFWWLSGDRIHEGQHRFGPGSAVGQTRRAHRIEPEEASPVGRDYKEAADECRGAASCLRRRKRAGRRRHRVGDGLSFRLLMDRHRRDQR